MRNDNLIIKARKASGFTQDMAADALGISRPTYFKKEHSPTLFTVEDLRKLHDALPNPESRRLLARYVSGIFSSFSF